MIADWTEAKREFQSTTCSPTQTGTNHSPQVSDSWLFKQGFDQKPLEVCFWILIIHQVWSLSVSREITWQMYPTNWSREGKNNVWVAFKSEPVAKENFGLAAWLLQVGQAKVPKGLKSVQQRVYPNGESDKIGSMSHRRLALMHLGLSLGFSFCLISALIVYLGILPGNNQTESDIPTWYWQTEEWMSPS